MADTHFNLIIIGSGAGGGTLAYRLAPTGKKTLILERGDYVPRERENWDLHSVAVDGRYNIAGGRADLNPGACACVSHRWGATDRFAPWLMKRGTG